MEISIVIGMVVSFLLGAWVRKPFSVISRGRRPEEKEAEERKKTQADEYAAMMAYTDRDDGQENF